MTQFRNPKALDWLTGYVARAGWLFIDPYNQGTANGQLLTPALFHLNLGNGNKLISSSNYQLTNTGQNNSYNLFADVPNLTTIEWADNTREVQVSGSCVLSGCILKFNGETGSYKIQNNTNAQGRIQNCVVEKSDSTLVFYILTAGFNDNVVLSKLFIAAMSGGVDVFTNSLLRDVDFYDTIENDALDHGKLIVTERFKISSTNASLKLQALANCFFDRSCVVIVGSTTYTTIEDAVIANPTWFQHCTIGDFVSVGILENGENLIPIDSEVYSAIDGFASKTLCPGKASWIVNSSSQWLLSDVFWVNGRLQAGLSSGYAQIEIYTQGTGLINPTLWLSQGLNYNSNTPTAHAGMTTFMADVKLIGDNYSGVFRAYCWNDPIGIDASGITSGEDGYNPTTRIVWHIESFILQAHVQQGANLANTGVKGAYLAPSLENLGAKIMNVDGLAIENAAVKIRGIEYLTDQDGFIDLLYESNGIVDVEISAVSYQTKNVQINPSLDYEYHEIILIHSLVVVVVDDSATPIVNSTIEIFQNGEMILSQLAPTGTMGFVLPSAGTYLVSIPESNKFIPIDFDGESTVYTTFVFYNKTQQYRVRANGEKNSEWSNILEVQY